MKKWLEKTSQKKYFQNLMQKLDVEYQEKIIFPKKERLFYALELIELKDLKVVILGQDPYHNENQANGLAFSVYENTPLPKSLINIYKELENDLGIKRKNGDLTNWAKQGVLLLNTCLSVEKNKPGSHKSLGWEQFSNDLILYLDENCDNLVFVLWGNYAISKKKLISNKHTILTSSHPSPLSAYHSFFGSCIFSKINQTLKNNNKVEIDFS